MPPPTLEQLYRNYLDTGDEAALELWIRRSSPALRQLARRLGASADDAEDLVQETLVAAIQGADRYDPARPMLPWLKGILTFRAARLARGELRRRRHYENMRHDVDASVAPPDPGASELDAEVRAAIDDLPRHYREPLVQYLLAERTPVEIASSLGVERATIRVRLHRGLRRLRDALQRWAAPLLLILLGRRASAATFARAAVLLVAALSAVLFWWRPWREAGDPRAAGATTATATSGDVDAGDERRARPARPAAVDRVAAGTTADATSTLTIAVRGNDGTARAHVGVTLAPESGSDRVLHRRAAVTDGDGVVRWSAVPPGRYRVQLDRGPATTVTLDGGSHRETLTVPAFGTTDGVVVDGSGTPVAGAAVWLSEDGDGPWRGQDVVRSDADGRFRLADVPAGRFLAARHPDFARSDVERIGATTAGMTLRLGPRGGRMAVAVERADGTPVGDAAIHLGHSMDAEPMALAQGASPWTTPPFVGRTDAAGRFRSAAMRAGSHPVFVRARGCAPQRVMLDVAVGAELHHRVRLQAGADIAGRVRDPSGAPVAGAFVVFRHEDTSAWIDLHTGDDGRFRFECVPAGHCDVLAQAPGHAPAASHLHVRPGERHRPELLLQPTRLLSGTVAPIDDAWPGRLQVRAQWPPSALRDDRVLVEADERGAFTIPGIAASRPRLAIRLPGEPVFRGVDALTAWRDGHARITLPTDFAADSWIRGTCTDDRGVAIADAHVFTERDGSWAEVGRTDRDGDYQVGPLPSGTYRVFVESTSPHSPTVVGAEFSLPRGATVRRDLRAADVGGVAVELTRADGRPLDAVLATVQRLDLHRRFAISNRAQFERRLEAGDYELSVMGPATEWIDSLPFTVRAGETTPLRVALRAATRCTLIPNGLPDRIGGTAMQFTFASTEAPADRKVVDLLPDAPLRIGAVLPAGSYVLRHQDADGRVWQGPFAVDASTAPMSPVVVPMHLVN